MRRDGEVPSLSNRSKTDRGEMIRDTQGSNRRSHVLPPESPESRSKRAALQKCSEKPFPTFDQKTQTDRFRGVKTRACVLGSVCGQ